MRTVSEGGTYHVMARGNNRRRIFEDDVDRHRFLRLLADVGARREWLGYAYCLMGNHVHLVMTTTRPDLGDGMRDVLARYARRFNQRHGRSGHLFSERYRMVSIGDDSHLLATIRYVARNPVEAGLSPTPGDWAWGSYRAIATGAEPPWVSSEVVLSYFHPVVNRARVLLAQFVEAEPNERLSVGLVPALRSPSVETLIQLLGAKDGARAAADLGYSHQRIAMALGLSRTAVTKRLSRHRSLS